MENTVAASAAFATDVSPVEVKLDVTKLVKQFRESNPDENIITIALCDTEGNRLHIGSREGGETRVPKLSIHTSVSEINVTGVTVTPDKLELEVDGQQQISAEVAPADAANKNVTWTPKDSSIAEVDNTGMVTAKSAGTTMITAKTEDGGFEASCEVTVTEKAPEEIAVTGITIDPAELTLNTCESGKLTASAAPENAANKNVTWVSEDSSIAEVDANGNVTAKAAGVTTVTVKTEDGNYTAGCKITVKAKNAGNNNNNNSNNNSNNNNTVNGDKNKPASNNGTTVSTVKTGDTTSIMFTIVLLAGAAAVSIGCVVIRKKGKSRR